MRRRAFLAACVAGGVAGCRGGDDADGDPTGTDGGGPETATETATATAGSESATTGRPSATPTGTPTATATEAGGGTASDTTAPPTTAASTATAVFPGYETVAVEVTTPDGDRLGAVTAAVADTYDLRVTGLSDTESLPEDVGMLFVYDEVGDHTYVMREMDFGLDIVFADDEGAITEIHHAPAPGPNEDGEDQEYPGRGQYVFEVNRGWTTERGVEEGDVLRFDL